MCRLCSHKSPAQKSSAGFLPKEGGSGSSSCGDCNTSANPVTHLPPPSMGEGDRDSGGRGPRQRHIKLIAEGDTFPSEPFEPGPPPPPSARRAVAPFCTTRRHQAAYKTSSPAGRYHHLLNPLNLLNPLPPHARRARP